MRKGAIFLIIFLPFASIAGENTSTKWAQTSEATCYNHPDKQLCLDGIKALMRSVKAASDVNYSCLQVKKAGGEMSEICQNAESSLSTLE